MLTSVRRRSPRPLANRLGRKLHINPTTESFVNDSEADAMLTREYRKGFEVPAKIG